jgi:hypothetical protein
MRLFQVHVITTVTLAKGCAKQEGDDEGFFPQRPGRAGAGSKNETEERRL